jgi:hypothetical protein
LFNRKQTEKTLTLYISLDKFIKYSFFWIFLLTISPRIFAQENPPPATDVQTDTLHQQQEGTAMMLDAEVKYQASDSIKFGITSGKMYLYGDASINYEDITLTAQTIELDLDSSLAVAYGTIDTLGNEVGLPVFKDRNGEYEMRRLKYNFQTKKAIIEHIVTDQGDGFIVGSRAKKIENNIYCIKNARYSTCNHHDHPHFYLNLTKAKVIPGKKIITGPAYLVIEDVKFPVIVPFAIIPSTQTYSSGFILPSYGEESNRGFFLRNGGYYWAASQYFDANMTADIYTNGSWGSHFSTKYKRRYKFGGNMNFNYIVNIFSEPDLPDYRKTKDFSVTWSHRQDPKSNPYQSFSASVNFSTSSYDHNNVNSIVDPNIIARNTKRSSVSYSKRWAGKPINFSANLLHSQNSRDTTIDFTLPDLTFTVNRLYPFKRKNKIGNKERFYEKISFSYTGNMKNYIHTKERDLSFKPESITRDWKNGVAHNIPVAMNLKVLKYFTLSPTFNYKERWYFKSVTKDWDPALHQVIETDTTGGFHRVWDYSMGVGTSTKIYTFYRPWRKLFGDKIQAIRHVATPSVSMSYRPDFSDPRYGYYDWFEYYDPSLDEIVKYQYSYYDGAIYGVPGKGKSGNMGISLGNTLEMKVKSTKDTTGFKKIKLLEGLNFNSSYNFLADSLGWSRITMTGRTKVMGTNINFGAYFNPYGIDTLANGRPVIINQSALKTNGKLLRVENVNLSFGFNINNNTFKKKKNNEQTNTEDTEPEMDVLDEAMISEEDRLMMEMQPSAKRNLNVTDDGYAKFEMPWNLSINFTSYLILDQSKFNKDKMNYEYKFTADISVNGKISVTPKWNISATTGYSLESKKIAYTTIGITRDLHCWGMRLNLTPIGRYKSYFFSISVNSSLLKDLKYEKRSHPRDNPGFYD